MSDNKKTVFGTDPNPNEIPKINSTDWDKFYDIINNDSTERTTHKKTTDASVINLKSTLEGKKSSIDSTEEEEPTT